MSARIVLGGLLAVLLAGCVIEADLSKLSYGAPPPDNYELLIRSYFDVMLKDPYSAHFYFDEPEKFWIRNAPIEGGKLRGGWSVRVEVNAKNGYGGYTGRLPYYFFFQEQKLQSVKSPDGIWRNL